MMPKLAQLIIKNLSRKKVDGNKFYRKWIGHLKQKKLFDEYMVYVTTGLKPKVAHPVINDYETLFALCDRLNRNFEPISQYGIRVDWVHEFKKFYKKNIHWWQFMTKYKISKHVK